MPTGGVTNIRPVGDIDNKFGDIGRVVPDTLNSLCGKQVVKADQDGPLVFHHVGRKFSCKGTKLLVDTWSSWIIGAAATEFLDV
jgi:hypothetical protein